MLCEGKLCGAWDSLLLTWDRSPKMLSPGTRPTSVHSPAPSRSPAHPHGEEWIADGWMSSRRTCPSSPNGWQGQRDPPQQGQLPGQPAAAPHPQVCMGKGREKWQSSTSPVCAAVICVCVRLKSSSSGPGPFPLPGCHLLKASSKAPGCLSSLLCSALPSDEFPTFLFSHS